MRISDWSSDVCSSDLRLTVDARPGRGCCFSLTLRPASAAAAGGLRAAGAPDGAAAIVNPLAGAEVVVLEGPEAASLRKILVSWGAVVRPVAAGELAAVLEIGRASGGERVCQ